MGQTMSDTPEAPRQSLGKRVRFGDGPSEATGDESAATAALNTLAEASAAASLAAAGDMGSTCSGTAGEPADEAMAEPVRALCRFKPVTQDCRGGCGGAGMSCLNHF